jgi:hypothetical protein
MYFLKSQHPKNDRITFYSYTFVRLLQARKLTGSQTAREKKQVIVNDYCFVILGCDNLEYSVTKPHKHHFLRSAAALLLLVLDFSCVWRRALPGWRAELDRV